MIKRNANPETGRTLRGWAAIARFLELPASTAQRWAKEGMPVRREGRNVVASADELRKWLGTAQSGDPVNSIVGSSSDLTAELSRSLKGVVRPQKRAA